MDPRVIKGLLAGAAAALSLFACSPGQDAAQEVTAAGDGLFDGLFVIATEPVAGSDIPVHLMLVETIDGLYTPIGLRKPAGDGPFPIILFAHMNGGGGISLLRDMSHNMSWTMDRFLEAGYAVAWLRYRAEVDGGYYAGGDLVEGMRQGRQLFNRAPLEYEDEIDIINYVKTLAFVDAERVGLLGLSHGGEMVLKITSEIDVTAAIANEPAASEYLGEDPRRPPPDRRTEAGERDFTDKEFVKRFLDKDVAMERLRKINTPLLVQGRDDDHNQGVFELAFEWLREAGKEVEWASYDHPEHGFVFPIRHDDGSYQPDQIQVSVVRDSIEFFDRYMKP